MKLYAKQQWFSLKQNVEFFDEHEQIVYFAQGFHDWLGRRKVSLIDCSTNEEVAYIKQRSSALSPTLEVTVDGQPDLLIRKKAFSFKPFYIIDGEDWTVEGSFMAFDYAIYDSQRNVVARITKQILKWTDTFEIDIQDSSANVVHILCIVLAIHAILSQQHTAAAT